MYESVLRLQGAQQALSDTSDCEYALLLWLVPSEVNANCEANCYIGWWWITAFRCFFFLLQLLLPTWLRHQVMERVLSNCRCRYTKKPSKGTLESYRPIIRPPEEIQLPKLHEALNVLLLRSINCTPQCADDEFELPVFGIFLLLACYRQSQLQSIDVTLVN